MRARVLSPQFATATKYAAKFTAKRSHLPVTNNVLLEAVDSELWLTSTDLQTTLTQRIPAQVDEAGSITLPAKLLAETAGRADSEVTEIITEDHTATITEGRQSARLSGIDAEDFPPVPKHFGMATAIVDAQQFAGAAKQVASMTDKPSGYREALQCINFELTPAKLTLTASDAFRLGIRNMATFGNDIGQTAFMVPAESITKLLSLVPKRTESLIYVALSKSHVAFSVDDYTVICTLSNATAPDYAKIIPDHADTDIIIGRVDLLEAVKVCNSFAKLDSGIIRLAAMSTDRLSVSARFESEAGVSECIGKIDAAIVYQGTPPIRYISDNLPEPITGKPQAEIAFDGVYLINYLAKLKTDSLCIGITSPDMAALFTPMSGRQLDTESQTVIMPMTIKNREPLPEFNAWGYAPEEMEAANV